MGGEQLNLGLTEVGLNVSERHDRAVSASTTERCPQLLPTGRYQSVYIPELALCEEGRREANGVVEGELDLLVSNWPSSTIRCRLTRRDS